MRNKAFHPQLAPKTWIADGIFETKSGALVQFLPVERPVSLSTLSPEDQAAKAKDYNAAVRAITPGFRHYTYWRKRSGGAIIRKERYASPQVQELADRRQAYLEHGPLHTVELWHAILYQPAAFSKLWSFSSQRAHSALESSQAYQIEQLRHCVSEFVNQMRPVMPMAVADRTQAFRYLRMLVNPPDLWESPVPDDKLDFYLADASPAIGYDFLQFGELFVRALTLKNAPRTTLYDKQQEKYVPSTVPNLLQDLLRVEGDFLLTTEYAPQEIHKSRRGITILKSNQFSNITSGGSQLLKGANAPRGEMMQDDAATQNVKLLGEAEAIVDRGNYLGDFSFTVTSYGASPEEARATLKRASQVLASKANLVVEDDNLFETVLATIPGNTARTKNLRLFHLPVDSYSDLTLLPAEPAGQLTDPHLEDEYLTILRTQDGQPHYLMPRIGELFMAMLMGESGSGKSSLAIHLAAMYQKYAKLIDGVWRQPKTLIYDLGHSFEGVTRYYGGSFQRITLDDEESKQNPFSFAPTLDNLSFVTSWFRFLLTNHDHYVLTPDEEIILSHAVESIFALKERKPKLARLGQMILPDDTPGRLATRLERWRGGLFDTAENTISRHDWQTYEFRGFEKHPDSLAAYLYLNNEAWNAHLYDPKLARLPKLWVMDEAHLFMTNQSLAMGERMVQRVTLNRKNELSCLFIMPWGKELEGNPSGSTLNSACPVKFFARSPKTKADYERIFGLTPHVAEMVESLKSPGEVLFHTDAQDVKLTADFDEYSLLLQSNSPKLMERKQQLFAMPDTRVSAVNR
ncbi:MAG: VirB4 family type IV secretion system protein [Bryobacteraceae bacterium]|jgi:type IV secretory pathway VirB4 component